MGFILAGLVSGFIYWEVFFVGTSKTTQNGKLKLQILGITVCLFKIRTFNETSKFFQNYCIVFSSFHTTKNYLLISNTSKVMTFFPYPLKTSLEDRLSILPMGFESKNRNCAFKIASTIWSWRCSEHLEETRRNDGKDKRRSDKTSIDSEVSVVFRIFWKFLC